jgi:two-component system, cell cycle sensor histidine kinase and response regulator CckA
MPHMNGRGLSDRMAEIRAGIKVLFTSGYSQSVIAHHGVLEEGLEFIAKPYTNQQLSVRVREVLDS